MIIAFDYDDCYTIDSKFWDAFISYAKRCHHIVVCVTYRYEHENAEQLRNSIGKFCDEIIFTGRKAKLEFVNKMGIYPDIWIDDNPLTILADGGIFVSENEINEPIDKNDDEEWGYITFKKNEHFKTLKCGYIKDLKEIDVNNDKDLKNIKGIVFISKIKKKTNSINYVYHESIEHEYLWVNNEWTKVNKN